MWTGNGTLLNASMENQAKEKSCQIEIWALARRLARETSLEVMKMLIEFLDAQLSAKTYLKRD